MEKAPNGPSTYTRVPTSSAAILSVKSPAALIVKLGAPGFGGDLPGDEHRSRRDRAVVVHPR